MKKGKEYEREEEEEDGCVGNSGWTASMSAAAFRRKAVEDVMLTADCWKSTYQSARVSTRNDKELAYHTAKNHGAFGYKRNQP